MRAASRSTLVRVALVAALTLGAAALAARPSCAEIPADTSGARVLLSWKAPAGQPRATASLLGACGDTSAVDTLWICLVPGRDAPTLNGFTAELRLRPTPPDTLAGHWTARRQRNALAHFDARFAPDSVAGAATPFRVRGLGFMLADVVPEGVRLRLVFAVAADAAAPIRAGQTYALAQVLVRRPSRHDVACAQALCVEWVTGTLAFQVGYEPSLTHGERFLGLHAPVDGVCAQWSRSTAKPWNALPRPH